MSVFLNIIVFLPFISAAFLGISYLVDKEKKLNEKYYSFIGILIPVIITVLSFLLAIEVASTDSKNIIVSTAFNWLNIDDFVINLSFMADRLSVTMISFITFIGTLIHIYAAGYMKGDEGFGKFFSYFNLFLGSMLLLVLADNPIVMFIGWELVGLASYLLIGFYFKESKNITAANKAFIVNRVGDFGFIIALATLFVALEGSGFTFTLIEQNIMKVDNSTLVIVGILLFVGAMGKSAQIPLYVWLPDAMAGPTPVSALIHAATMVTAGVYMVARFGFLYNEIPSVGEFIAIIGIASALFAAIIASYQSDIKKILAYSTMSQLGYMFVAVGLGAYSFGIFHVFTHAFFKALLFMGAGAVIIALHHEQNIFKMGNLKNYIPGIFIMMLIATLAISGIPPFAGFFSKDAILNHAFLNGNYMIWVLGVATAFLTAFYMFRMLFIVFYGDGHGQKLHNLDKKLVYPLFVLAVGSTLIGLLGANEAYGGSGAFFNFLSLPDNIHHASHSTEYILGVLNIAVSVAGIYIASKMFIRKQNEEPVSDTPWKKLVIHKFFVDEVYDRFIVQNLRVLSEFFNKIIDEKLVDGFINFIIKAYMGAANSFSSLQNANVRYYAIYIISGVSLMCISLLIILGGK
jgi:NADH-quinone oxidoreductase subunit L